MGPDEPALHAQASAESLPEGELARAGQLEHAVADNGDAAYFPATQSTHTVVPNCEACFPAPHSMQSASPSPVVYLPAMHAVHVDEELAEYVPARQVAHVVAGTNTDDDDHVPVKPL